jgi:VanZ family protein
MAAYPPTYSRTLETYRPKLTTWVPALFAVMVICVESQNGLGAMRTFGWVKEFMHWTGHQTNVAFTLNHYLRKCGHFTGYGLLGLCFARGWMSLLRRRIQTTWSGLRMRAGACGVASALVVASCDEFHQVFLPTRGASVWDVLLDTSGALTVALLLFGYLALRRHVLVQSATGPLTTLGLSLSSLPHRMVSGDRVRRLRQSAGRRVHAVRGRINSATIA